MHTLYRTAVIAVAALFLGSAAQAEMPNKGRFDPVKTRAEAIEKTKNHLTEIQTRLARLEKMTDAEWAAEKKARQESQKERRAQRMKDNKAGAPAMKKQ